MSKSRTRFNPPPNWPVKRNFSPPTGWEPDPAWGQPPQGWPLYVTEQKKSHRFRNFFVLPILAIIAVIIIITAAASGSNKTPTVPAAGIAVAPSTAAKTSAAPPTATQTPKPTKKAPTYTVSQQNAIKSADSYLAEGMGFSRAGLIEQLSSSAGEGFSKADAVFGVEHAVPAGQQVDWNKQALESAKGYLASGSFSRAGLLEQLTSSAGSGFTVAQATYAVNKVGL